MTNLTTDIHTARGADIERDGQEEKNFNMTMTNIHKGGDFMNESSMTFDTSKMKNTTFANGMHN
jgi:hypothetical protein